MFAEERGSGGHFLRLDKSLSSGVGTCLGRGVCLGRRIRLATLLTRLDGGRLFERRQRLRHRPVVRPHLVELLEHALNVLDLQVDHVPEAGKVTVQGNEFAFVQNRVALFILLFLIIIKSVFYSAIIKFRNDVG